MKYNSVQVPYPKDTENLLSLVDKQEKESIEKLKEYLISVDEFAAELKKEVSEENSKNRKFKFKFLEGYNC